MNYITRRVVIAALCALVSAAVHQCARAQSLQTLISPSGAVGLQYGSGSVKFMDRSPLTALMERKITLGANQGVVAAERYALTLGGNAIEAVATRTVPAAALSVAAASAFATGFEVGGAMQHWLGYDTAVDIGPLRCTTSATGWQCDPGVEAGITKNVVYFCSGGCQYQTPASGLGSPSAVAADEAQKRNAENPGLCPNGNTVSYSAGGVTQETPALWTVKLLFTGCTGSVASSDLSVSSKVVDQPKPCPAVVDALNPAWSHSEGLSVGADGKCPTGRYTSTANSEVAQKLSKLGAMPVPVIDEILRKQPIEGASPRDMSGPASVGGQPQTTTTTAPGPNGEPVTTTTTNTPTTRYTYAGDTINYTTTNVTVTNNGGNTTTTTTTTGGGAQADPDDPCSKHPDTAGCAMLGTADGDPSWDTKDIAFTPVDMPAGSCPADRYFTFHTWALPLHYQPACDAAPVVKIGMLLCATITAIAIITSAVTK